MHELPQRHLVAENENALADDEWQQRSFVCLHLLACIRIPDLEGEIFLLLSSTKETLSERPIANQWRLLIMRRSIIGLVHRTRTASLLGTHFAAKGISARSWLSSSSAASGSGGKKGQAEGSGRQSKSGANNNNNSNSKDLNKVGARGTSPFKRMADAVKEKTIGLKAAGDKVSSDRVKHDRTSKRFTLDLGNNRLARIDYKTIGPDKIEMYHSEVPAELRGRGLGKALARGSLEQAARENMRVKLTCTYLIDFVNKSTDPKLKRALDS